jgi:hypothetical protein
MSRLPRLRTSSFGCSEQSSSYKTVWWTGSIWIHVHMQIPTGYSSRPHDDFLQAAGNEESRTTDGFRKKICLRSHATGFRSYLVIMAKWFGWVTFQLLEAIHGPTKIRRNTARYRENSDRWSDMTSWTLCSLFYVTLSSLRWLYLTPGF